MVELNHWKKYVPYCETRVFLGDQYSWPEKDTTQKVCNNGSWGIPIYACNGNVSRSLPLTMVPRYNQVHPSIGKLPPSFGVRDASTEAIIRRGIKDYERGILEGLYVATPHEYNPYAEFR